MSDLKAQYPSWNSRYTNSVGNCLRMWADQNYGKIIALGTQLPKYNNYLDIAITRNFPYPYIIQTLNDFSSEHLPVVLHHSVQSYGL